MKAREAAMEAARALAAAGIDDAPFEAEYLVRSAAGLSRAHYFAGAEFPDELLPAVRALIERRTEREPAAYLVGHREFRGLDFEVGPGVLIPRPETELLVEVALEAATHRPEAVVLDVGTGSGCVAVCVARELAGAIVVATDVSEIALSVARRNAARHEACVHFVRSDLAAAVGRADVVLANLPYIPSDEVRALQPEVSGWEPSVALDGGRDGLELVRRLVADCAGRLRPKLLALELGLGQAGAVAELAMAAGANPSVHKDLAGIDRVVCCAWA